MKTLLEIYKANNHHITEAELKMGVDAELTELKVFIDHKITTIKNQINDAKTLAKTKGEYSDPEWFNRARYAAKALGIISQKIQVEQSARKQIRRIDAENEKGSGGYKDCLLRAMNIVLPAELRKQVIRKADEFMTEMKGAKN